MSSLDSNSFDEALQKIGWGKYQIRNTIFSLAAAAILGAHVLSPIFISFPIKFQCDDKENSNKSFTANSIGQSYHGLDNVTGIDSCHRYECRKNKTNCWDNTTSIDDLKETKCKTFQYLTDPMVETSIVEDFQLICDRASLIYVLQSVFMVGVLLNGLLFGKLSDRIGRRKVVLIMAVVSTVLGIAIATVNSVEVYIVLRSLIGLFCFTFPTICVLTSETTPPAYRSFNVLVQGGGFSFGIAVLVAFAYFIRTWRTLQIAISVLFCVTIIIAWLFDESPRWLISRGKSNEASAILRKIFKANGKDDDSKIELKNFSVDPDEISPEDELISNKLKEENAQYKQKVKVENLGMSDTMRYQKMRLATIVISYSWFATSCVYYGLSLNVSKIGGNVYVNSLVMGVAGVGAAGLAIYLLRWIGRRTLIASNFILAGIFCITISFLPEGSGLFKTICFHLGRLLAMIPFGSLYLYTIELYPTVLRSTAVNCGSSFARVGSVVAGLIAMLHLLFPVLPYVIYGLLALVAGIFNLLLPETRNQQMFETMKQTENFIRNNPGPLWRICKFDPRSSLANVQV